MPFGKFTRPGGSPVYINIAEILSFAPVPEGSAAKKGTRILFRVKTHQDVLETIEEVASRIVGATGAMASLEPPPPTAAPFGLPPFIDAPPSRLEGYPGYPAPDRLESGAGGPVAHRMEGHPDHKKR